MSLDKHPFFSAYNKISSPYGYRTHPVTGEKNSFHTGIDLVKAHQSPIYAFTEGLVVYATNGISGTGFGNMGNVIAVKSQHPYTKEFALHCYMHLDSIVVKKGQYVDKGQMIGRQGMTGIYVTGSHLHYEIRKVADEAPPYGWTQDPLIRCYNPEEYLSSFYQQDSDDSLSVQDANKIIRFLSAGWFIVEGDTQAEREFNRLANKLRVLSGQKEGDGS